MLEASTNLIKDIDGKIYRINKLWAGVMEEVTEQDLKSYSYSAQSCLVKDTDGKVINLIEAILTVVASRETDPNVALLERKIARLLFENASLPVGRVGILTDLEKRVDKIENLTPVWQSQNGTGSITIHDGFEGTIKDLIIKGKTSGGWNEETQQFDNIVSVGESEGNKVIIKSVGKNLFDISNIFELGHYFHYQTGAKQKNKLYNAFKITANAETKYTIQGIQTVPDVYQNTHICFFDINMNYISGDVYNVSTGLTHRILTTPKNCNYIVVSNGINTDVNNQIEEGTVATQYEPYQEDKKEILLPFTGGLKGLPNGIQDIIESEKPALNQKVFNKNILSTDDIKKTAWSNYTNTIHFEVSIDNSKKISTANIICNNFLSQIVTVTDKVGVCIWGDGNRASLIFGIEKSRLETSDVAGFKKWLQVNPTTVLYELETPIIHNIEKMTLPQYAGTTHLIQGNEIKGEISCTAKISLSAQNNRLKKENISLKEELKNYSSYFNAKDVDLTSNDLELDFRLMELEFTLDIPINLNKRRMMTMAATPYEMMRTVIIGGKYDRADYENKIKVYVSRGRMTLDEAEDLISLMDAKTL